MVYPGVGVRCPGGDNVLGLEYEARELVLIIGNVDGLIDIQRLELLTL